MAFCTTTHLVNATLRSMISILSELFNTNFLRYSQNTGLRWNAYQLIPKVKTHPGGVLQAYRQPWAVLLLETIPITVRLPESSYYSRLILLLGGMCVCGSPEMSPTSSRLTNSVSRPYKPSPTASIATICPLSKATANPSHPAWHVLTDASLLCAGDSARIALRPMLFVVQVVVGS